MAPTHNQNLTTPVFAAVDTGLFQETGGLVRKLGEEGEFDHGRIFGLWSPHGLIERPNELCIYYGGCNLGKNTNTQIQRPVPGHQRRRLGGPRPNRI